MPENESAPVKPDEPVNEANEIPVADDVHYRVETKFWKEMEVSSVLNFKVMLRSYSDYGDAPGPVVGHLRGFLYQPGYMPEDYNDYFDVFDMRSAHATEAYRLLVEHPSTVDAALGADGYALDDMEAVAYLERSWVHSGLRGRKIALRLFREAMHIISRPGLLVMLKAYPDGEASPVDCRKLANYYRSDKRLCFNGVSSRNHPGWLVGHWAAPCSFESDELIFDLDVGPLALETDDQLD